MVSLCVTLGLRLLSTKRYFIRIHAAHDLNQRRKKRRNSYNDCSHGSYSQTATDLQLLHFNPYYFMDIVNPLSPELNPICYLLALLAHHFLHVSRIRVKSLTLR